MAASEHDLDDLDELDRSPAPTVEQQVPLDVPPDEVWELLTEADGLDWLGESVEIDLVPGGTGHVIDDDGVHREVLVTGADPDSGITWHWWSDEGDLSSVQITLEPLDDGPGTLVRVIETLAAPPSTPQAMASASCGTQGSGLRLTSRTALVITC